MKNIIILIALVFGVTTAKAQYTSAVAPLSGSEWSPSTGWTMKYYTAGDDTASGADVIRMGAVMNGKYDVVISLTATRVSGTIGAGSIAYIRTSADGVNWRTICEAAAVSYKDTQTVANAASGTYTWQFTANEVGSKYIEVYYDQSTGTSPVVAPVAKIYYRKSED